MKHFPAILLLSTALSLSACGQMGEQLFDPDITFAQFGQPDVKGVNDTQEEMAKDAFAGGNYKRAAELYQQILDTKKGTPEQILRYKLGIAESSRRLGHSEESLAMYEELYKEHSSNIEVMEGRGLALMANGKSTDAGRAFADVMEKDPKRWRTLNALGILFVTKNMVPEAIAYYTEALTNSPDNPAVLNNVGLSYATDRNFPRAIEALQQASRVSKTPNQRKQIDLNLAMVHGVAGDMESARTVASKYLEGPALDNNLGLYAHLAKDDALAKSYLNMALSQSPTYYERAWENLDVVNDASNGEKDGSKAPIKAKASAAKLPKLDALRTAPAESKKKGKRGSKASAAPAAAEPIVEPAIAVESTAKEEAKPEDKPAEPEKKDEKPSGLVVTPGE